MSTPFSSWRSFFGQTRTAANPRVRRSEAPTHRAADVLEARQMMSGNVEVDVVDGVLSVKGDHEDNVVSIYVEHNYLETLEDESRIAEIVLTVYGNSDTSLNGVVDLNGLAFSLGTVDLASTEPVVGLEAFDIDMGAGDDRLWVSLGMTPIDLYPIGTSLDGAITARSTADLAVALPITPTSIYDNSTVDLGAGDDVVRIRGANFERRLTIYGRAGEDRIRVESAGRFQYEAFRNVTVIAGAGADDVTISAHVERTATILTGGGDDTVNLNGMIHRANVTTSGGHDEITAAGSMNYFRARTGGGEDQVRLTASVAHETRIDTGAGNDVVALVEVAPIRFYISDQFASLESSVYRPLPHWYQRVLRANLAGTTRIVLGGGNDILRTSVPNPAVEAVEDALVELESATFNGGGGDDRLEVSQSMLEDLASARVRRFDRTDEILPVRVATPDSVAIEFS